MKKPRVLTMTGREMVWLAETTIIGALGAFVAKKLLRALYRAVRKQSPDLLFDSRSARFSWPDLFLWAATAGLGLGIAKVAGARLATIGWKATTGTLPPGVGDEQLAG